MLDSSGDFCRVFPKCDGEKSAQDVGWTLLRDGQKERCRDGQKSSCRSNVLSLRRLSSPSPHPLFTTLRMYAFTTPLLLALLPWPALADPPNHANSTVPYTLPATAKYDYSEVLHKVGNIVLNDRIMIGGADVFVSSLSYSTIHNGLASSLPTAVSPGADTAAFSVPDGEARTSLVGITRLRTPW